ncbi:helix-turn-helix domain-containing protein [Streptomyces tateyamensis]|uniref:helix-turn-helix domain-containing protein n=1 Tax=Streptomyces tateyamensis TaxID=565073 RepID=UPI001FE548EF|nr:pyridoxamine 5'-phosphate oxidase family protein [Streptomyces tateyamensis]
MNESRTPSDGSAGAPTPQPGELARRVALRRGQLGLSREELAHQAGMAPRYLQLLEELGGDFDTGGLLRLAAVLETTPRELLEGSTDGPPGQGAAAPRPILWKLEPEECRDRLGTHGVGRVALSTPAGPAVLPVNYTVLGGAIVYRTAPDTVTAAAAGSEVAFEVDQVDEALRQGWSVLVVGRAERVTEPDAVQLLTEQAAAEPWAGGKRDLWVRINPTRVTGRIIRT